MLQKPFGSFCQYLKNVPARLPHDIENALDEIVGNILVEKVTHGVHENRARLLPVKRQTECMLMNGRLEPIHVVALAHCLKMSTATEFVTFSANIFCLTRGITQESYGKVVYEISWNLEPVESQDYRF